MTRFIKLFLPLLLIAGVALGAGDRRSVKMAEEPRDVVPEGLTSIAGVNDGWLATIPNASAFVIKSVSYMSNGVVWAAGYQSASPQYDIIWQSKDGGLTWTSTLPPTKNAGVTEFAVMNDSTVVFGTFDGKIFRTANNGAKYDSVYNYGGWFNGMRRVSGDTLIAVGDYDASGYFMVRSTDGGKTWARVTNLPPAVKDTMYFTYSSYRQGMDTYGRTVWVSCYRSGYNPMILKSTDAGTTWAAWSVPLTGGVSTNYYFRSINFLNDSLGWAIDRQTGASGTANYLHKTTNGGLTWSDTLNVGPGLHNDQLMQAVKPIRGTTHLVGLGQSSTGGVKARVWWSTNLGTSWTSVDPAGSATLTNGDFISTTKGVIVGTGQGYARVAKNVRKVVFNANTATVPDTIPVVGSNVQIRGGANGNGFSPVTWGNDAQNNMTAVGGDYWTKTLLLQAGDTLNYKITIAYATGTGWESGVVPANFPTQTNANRSLIVPDKDTTLAVEFYNNGANDRPQYFRPWTTVPDSFMNIYFRVNMLGPMSSGTYSFDMNKDTLNVRGGGAAGSDLDWAKDAFLTKEAAATNGGDFTVAANSFWSGRLKFPKSAYKAGDTVYYKFLLNSAWGRDELGGQPNRMFKIPSAKGDTTLRWVFYNNERPSARLNPDTVKLTFRANLAAAITAGGFAIGDSVYVRTGYFNTSADPGRSKLMTRLSGTIYTQTDTIVTAKGKAMDYQYYVLKNGVETRESYYNFYYKGAVASEAERRQFEIPSTATLATATVVSDTATSVTQARRQPQFPNARKLARKVNVTWEVNLKPAIYQLWWGKDTLNDVQSAFRNIVPNDKDSVQKWGVWMNGLAVGGWGNPGTSDWGQGLRDNLLKKMYDDKTNGDLSAGDTVWTRQILASPDSFGISSAGSKGQVGQIFKFGIFGGDNEGGSGGFGNNHSENVVDLDSVYKIHSQFGSINPAFFDAWDYDLEKPKTPTSVIDGTQPLTYRLEQNYPNPFNPTTKIEYSIPTQAQVEMKVYNLVGQEVATLINEVQKAGAHFVKFNATNLASGMYFYRISAGDFTSVKKMVLVK
jgi:hypothetical protein